MSLKTFHVIFISASILLALGFGGWELKAWLDVQRPMDLALGVGSLGAGIGLIVYERYFLKKLKHVSYL